MNISSLIYTGNYSEALLEINKKIDNGEYKYYFQKALVLYYLKEFAESERIYRVLYKQNKESGDLIYSLALVLKAQNKTTEAFEFLQLAYEKGNDQSIFDVINLIFERKGDCDYENCKDCCCKNVKLKGLDGLFVKDTLSFERLMANPNENQGWQKSGESFKGEWIFACRHLGENNVCKIYQERPQVCRDYPSGVLSLKKACSYYFELIPDIPKFTSKVVFDVVIDILQAYNYLKEKEILLNHNSHLF